MLTSEWPKNKKGKTEAEMFEIVACQADKKVSCEPGKKSACTTKANFKARAICRFSPQIWNLGATCIINNFWKAKYPQCSDTADRASIKAIRAAKSICRKPVSSDDRLCSRLGMSY